MRKQRDVHAFKVKESPLKKKDELFKLLKYLRSVWPGMIREDSLWNTYSYGSTNLDALAKQGYIVANPVYDKGITLNYYNLGLKGFEFLQQKRLNIFLIVVGIATVVSAIISIISLFI